MTFTFIETRIPFVSIDQLLSQASKIRRKIITPKLNGNKLIKKPKFWSKVIERNFNLSNVTQI